MDRRRGRYEAVNTNGTGTRMDHDDSRAQVDALGQQPRFQEQRLYPRYVSDHTQMRSPSPLDVSKQRGSTGTKRPGFGSYLVQWWKEFMAILVSVAFLVAVFLVLVHIQNTPLGDWNGPWSVQPTTLISILITFSKLFLLAAVAEAISQLKWVFYEKQAQRLSDIEQFDSASRGAFGAVLFLLLVRWKAILACCGALIIILAIGMEPFTQQTLSFINKAVTDGAVVASIPRANDYDLNTQVETSPYSGEMNSMKRKAYAPMLNSILQGLYNPDDTVSFHCPTTNCTWPEYQTLGVCSSCRDISSSLDTTCEYHNPNISTSGGGICRYKTPSGGKMEALCSQSGGGSQSTLWNSTTIDTSPPDIATIAAITFDAADYGSNCAFNRSFRMPQPVATECTLSWCAKSVHSRVTDGVLVENVTSQTNLIFPKDTCNASWGQNVDLGWALNKFPYVNFNQKPPPDVSIFAAFLPGDVPRNMCADWRFHPNSAMWINVQDSFNIASLLRDIFTGPDTTAYMGDTVFAELLYGTNHGNLTADLQAIADSMTNRIRQGPNSTMHTGTIWLNETYIRVNWPWFAFPSGLILLAIVFLLTAVVSSAQGSRVVWKSSSLALMFHGLHNWYNTGDNTYLRTTSEMKTAAEGISVKLADCPGNELKLVTQ